MTKLKKGKRVIKKLDDLPYYSQLILEGRDKLWITQRELAEMMGNENSYCSISRWENGTHVPSRKYCSLLAQILGGSARDYQLNKEPQSN